jgi:hypothetical protein
MIFPIVLHKHLRSWPTTAQRNSSKELRKLNNGVRSQLVQLDLEFQHYIRQSLVRGHVEAGAEEVLEHNNLINVRLWHWHYFGGLDVTLGEIAKILHFPYATPHNGRGADFEGKNSSSSSSQPSFWHLTQNRSLRPQKTQIHPHHRYPLFLLWNSHDLRAFGQQHLPRSRGSGETRSRGSSNQALASCSPRQSLRQGRWLWTAAGRSGVPVPVESRQRRLLAAQPW